MIAPRFLAALVFTLTTITAVAQPAYPTKPLRFIVVFPPGDGTDATMRLMSQNLSTRLGQPVVVDNRPGGNFVIGAQACTSAAPDGYTLCMVNGTMMSVNPQVMSKLPYDPERDFRPLTGMYLVLNGIFSHTGLPAASLKEFAQLAVTRPGGVDFGTLGPNSSSDIQRQWLNERWKANMTGIPYKGGNLIIAALAAQEIHATWIGLFNGMAQVKAGRVRLLAVFSPRRWSLMPDVPTLEELGYSNIPLPGWHGLALPAGAPDTALRRLSTDLIATFREPRFAENLANQALESIVSSPEEFATFIRRDRESTAEMVRRFNIPKQ